VILPDRQADGRGSGQRQYAPHGFFTNAWTSQPEQLTLELVETVDNQPVTQPPIYAIDNFLREEELAHLALFIELKEQQSGGFRRSLTEDDRGVPEEMRERSSSSVRIPKAATHLVRNIERRAAACFGLPASHVEPLQIVRYQRGEEYRVHHDMVELHKKGRGWGGVYLDSPSDEEKAKGVRVGTILVYLHSLDNGVGGCTHFPLPQGGLDFTPVRGLAIMWSNIKDADLTPDLRTAHEGKKILRSGCNKYALNIWVSNVPDTSKPNALQRKATQLHNLLGKVPYPSTEPLHLAKAHTLPPLRRDAKGTPLEDPCPGNEPICVLCGRGDEWDVNQPGILLANTDASDGAARAVEPSRAREPHENRLIICCSAMCRRAVHDFPCLANYRKRIAASASSSSASRSHTAQAPWLCFECEDDADRRVPSDDHGDAPGQQPRQRRMKRTRDSPSDEPARNLTRRQQRLAERPRMEELGPIMPPSPLRAPTQAGTPPVTPEHSPRQGGEPPAAAAAAAGSGGGGDRWRLVPKKPTRADLRRLFPSVFEPGVDVGTQADLGSDGDFRSCREDQSVADEGQHIETDLTEMKDA